MTSAANIKVLKQYALIRRTQQHLASLPSNSLSCSTHNKPAVLLGCAGRHYNAARKHAPKHARKHGRSSARERCTSTVPYSTAPYSTAAYSAAPCSTAPYSTVLLISSPWLAKTGMAACMRCP